MKIKREWRKYDLRHKCKYSIIWRSHQRNIDRCFDKIIEDPKKVVFEASVLCTSLCFVTTGLGTSVSSLFLVL
jgi:hypothetical protein